MIGTMVKMGAAYCTVSTLCQTMPDQTSYKLCFFSLYWRGQAHCRLIEFCLCMLSTLKALALFAQKNKKYILCQAILQISHVIYLLYLYLFFI